MTQDLDVPPTEMRLSILRQETPRLTQYPGSYQFDFHKLQTSISELLECAADRMGKLGSVCWAIAHVVDGDMCYADPRVGYKNLKFHIVGVQIGHHIPVDASNHVILLASSDEMPYWKRFTEFLNDVDRSATWRDCPYSLPKSNDWQGLLEELYLVYALRAFYTADKNTIFGEHANYYGADQFSAISFPSGLHYFVGVNGETAQEWINLTNDFLRHDLQVQRD